MLSSSRLGLACPKQSSYAILLFSSSGSAVGLHANAFYSIHSKGTPKALSPYRQFLRAARNSPYSTLTTTLQASAPASRIAHARHPLFLLLMMAFHPFLAHNALTMISRSDPNCRVLDSSNIFAAAGKLPRRSMAGEDEGVITLSLRGRCGTSAMLVMQSMTSTWLFLTLGTIALGLLVGDPDRSSSKDASSCSRSVDMCMTM